MFLRNSTLGGSNLPLSMEWQQHAQPLRRRKRTETRYKNQAMRLMTGAMCSTPISCLETITGLQSLEERCDIKVLTQDEKFKRLPNHPMSNITRVTKTRLLRTSFLKNPKILEKRILPLLTKLQNQCYKHQQSPHGKSTLSKL